MAKANVLNAVSGAFRASLALKNALAAMGSRAATADVFRMQAAQMVAKDANAFYKLTGDKCIVAYKGQRDIAFGVPQIDGEKVKHERTQQADATRKWFSRNVMGKKAVPPKAPGGVWAKIGEDLSQIARIRRKLTKGDQAAFHVALQTVVEKFAAKVV